MSGSATRRAAFILDLKGNAVEGFAKLESKITGAGKAYATHNKAAGDAASKLASLGGVINDVPVPGFEKLGKVVNAVGSSFEALANPIGAGIVAIGGTVAVTLAAAAASVSLVRASRDWIRTLKEANAAGDLISPEQEAAILGANRAMDALGPAAQRVGVIIAASFAPAVEGAAMMLVGLAQASEGVARSVGWVDLFVSAIGGSQVKTAFDAWSGFNLVLRDIGVELPSLTTKAEAFAKQLDKAAPPASWSSAVSGTMRERIAAGTPDMGRAAKIAGGAGAEILREQESAARAAEQEAKRIAERNLQLQMDLGKLWAEWEAEDAKRAAALQATLNRSLVAAEAMAKGLQGLPEAVRASMGAGIVGAAAGIQSSEDLLRMLPGGGILADFGQVLTGLPALVGDIRRDLVHGPLKIGQAFEKTMTTAIPKLIAAVPLMVENFIFKLPFAVAKGIVEGIPKILLSIAQAIGEAIKNALNFLKGGEDGKFYTGKEGKVLGTSFKKDEFSIFGMFDQDNRQKGKNRGHAVGTRHIPRTGLHWLHEGEEVNRERSRTTGGFGGGGVTIHVAAVYPRNLDEFIRELQARAGTYGFGGSFSRS